MLKSSFMSSSSAPSPQAEIYRFGPFEANPSTGKLHKRGIRIALEPRGFNVLLILVRSPGKTKLRAEIVREIWHPSKDPEEFYDHLGQAIAKIRRALGDSATNPRYIQTESGGYAFIAPVEKIRISGSSTDLEAGPEPKELPEVSEPTSDAEPRVEHFAPSATSPGSTPISQQARPVETPRFPLQDGVYGGEGGICVAISLSYGIMVGLALPAEVAYRWPEFRNWAVYASVGAGVASAFVAGITFALMRVGAKRFNALTIVAAGGLCVWTLLLAFAAAPWLPNESIVQANWQTLTAKVGVAKSLLEALGLPILSLVPVHAVFVLRQLISLGDIELVRKVLSRRSGLEMLRGTLVAGPMFSVVAYTVVTLWWLNANAHLLENLKIAPYYPLFVEIAATRAAAGLITLLVVLLWYLLRWNQLASSL